MPVIKYEDIEYTPIIMDGVRDASKAVPMNADIWPEHVVRTFRLKPGGCTPRHSHDWEHVNYIMKGRGKLTIDGEAHELAAGDFAFVPPNANHQFENPFDEELEFICIVPERGEY